MNSLYSLKVIQSAYVPQMKRPARGKRNRYIARLLGRAAKCKFGGYAIVSGVIYVCPKPDRIASLTKKGEKS